MFALKIILPFQKNESVSERIYVIEIERIIPYTNLTINLAV